jgi:hypothetical protein
MRRIKLILAAVVVMVATFAAFAGPAMAATQRCNVHDNNFVNCNGDRFVNPDRFFFDDGLRNDFFFPFNTFFFGDEDFANCPFLGDTSGIVNELDCLD